EVGVDAARYWFMMRRADSHLVFDIELAKARTDENPVFYVQMAHARMSGILRNAGAASESAVGAIELDALADADIDLVKTLLRFPALVEQAAAEHAPHRITIYCEELARLTHAWYHVSRVIGEVPQVERSRLLLARAVRQVFANALAILGIAAPDRM
ncbi:MAG: DALR anticodon-binding domain-containing protein, partial [Gemmatimonadales bacterium]